MEPSAKGQPVADLFIRALVLHLFADWFLQNEWMAVNKVNIGHPAGYVHAAIHGLLVALVFPWELAVWVGVLHWAIDLRFPLVAWRHLIRQTTEGPMAVHVAIWQDQVAHILVLFAAVAAVVSYG